MLEAQYYDGTKLLSMKDLNNEEPELYLCTTNRTGGKTTFFNRMEVNRFTKKQSQFGLLYRYNYELDDVADKFFKDIKELFFNEYTMEAKKRAKGIYSELWLYKTNAPSTKQLCGYALALNNADQIKKYSHIFNKVESMVFDEFQSETNHYCSDEVKKFLSVCTSVQRGQGQQHRRVPVYMLGNQVSIINPYYTALGISSRLNDNVNFLRGNGWVLENGFIESASTAQLNSGIMKAFANDSYVAYSTQNVYLNDNLAFVERPQGNARYLATLRYKNKDYSVKEYREAGVIYIDDSADLTYPIRISVTTNDHNINYVMLKNNDYFISTLRYYFEKGCIRFKDLVCKEVLLQTISY